ncbi:hypothetical protein SISNIDRAFT_419396 [Sistotremastrum niveocremeum HHB9708]|uniref:Homeodomain-like protein n=1 Tax=Sistotremastrum niveocremeum HHB9708 TaxID=1314777 RepID=A0A164NC19_9AGAM|nr:hypothetical protein SISNIDRAFT_419396 [Sistotremastrum niveocremeum HHB9708]
MPFRKISSDLKERALFLVDDDYTQAQVCEIQGVSLRSLQRWAENLERYGNVKPPYNPSQSRPSIMNADQVNALIDTLVESPAMYLD